MPLAFERDNVRGRADSATIDARNKKLELRGAVEIIVEPEAQQSAAPVKTDVRGRPVTIRAARANFDQATLHLVLPARDADQARTYERDSLSGTPMNKTA